MEIKDKYDVVIVGSGPAGGAAAKALTGSGLKVLIAEKDEIPRYKMCSGILFPSSLKFLDNHLGFRPEGILCEPGLVHGNRVYLTNDSPMMEVSFNAFDIGDDLDDDGLNVWRSEFDYWLCRQSDAELADNCRFDNFRTEDGEFVLQLRQSGKDVAVKSKYIIGADGTLSRVRSSAFPDFHETIGLIPNYEEYYLGEIDLDPGWLYIFMDRSITGYFATVFHKDGQIAVVTGAKKDEPIKDYYGRFKTFLEKTHGLKVKEKTRSHAIVLTDMSARENYCLGRENIVLAGEAGGFLRGGEGITSALTSGWAAGKAVLESENSGKPAVDHFRKLAADEMAVCKTVHDTLTAVIGFNSFTRP